MKRYEFEVLSACENILRPLWRRFHEAFPEDLGAEEASDRLASMFKTGLLFAIPVGTYEDLPWNLGAPNYSLISRRLPTVEEIRVAFAATAPGIAVGLTEQGGALLEATLQIDWDLYIDGETCEILDGRGLWETHMWTRTRSRLEEAVRFRYYGEAVPETEEYEVVSPWRATYWKTFSEGHHVKLMTGGLLEPHKRVAGSTEEERKWYLTKQKWRRTPELD